MQLQAFLRVLVIAVLAGGFLSKAYAQDTDDDGGGDDRPPPLVCNQCDSDADAAVYVETETGGQLPIGESVDVVNPITGQRWRVTREFSGYRVLLTSPGYIFGGGPGGGGGGSGGPGGGPNDGPGDGLPGTNDECMPWTLDVGC